MSQATVTSAPLVDLEAEAPDRESVRGRGEAEIDVDALAERARALLARP